MVAAGIGVVVIGRNEGERLRACLASLQEATAKVYVDSGSTDDSCTVARSLGFDVIELAVPPGFTAARARNTGIAHLAERHPDLIYVQTVDGDCEVRSGWLDEARRELEADSRRAVVFGRRRERFPNANVFHMACDDEWDVALGEMNSCGGDALFRFEALREVGGYNGALIAGEEPELCLRLRQHGWQIWSNGREMTWHDVAMSRMQQWWRRSKRTGFALSELVQMHGDKADPSWARLLRSAVTWSIVVVALIVALGSLAVIRHPVNLLAACLLCGLLFAQMVRLAVKKRNFGGAQNRLAWAWLIMVAKLAQAEGVLQFRLQSLTKRRAAIIEYKS